MNLLQSAHAAYEGAKNHQQELKAMLEAMPKARKTSPPPYLKDLLDYTHQFEDLTFGLGALYRTTLEYYRTQYLFIEKPERMKATDPKLIHEAEIREVRWSVKAAEQTQRAIIKLTEILGKLEHETGQPKELKELLTRERKTLGLLTQATEVIQENLERLTPTRVNLPVAVLYHPGVDHNRPIPTHYQTIPLQRHHSREPSYGVQHSGTMLGNGSGWEVPQLEGGFTGDGEDEQPPRSKEPPPKPR